MALIKILLRQPGCFGIRKTYCIDKELWLGRWDCDASGSRLGVLVLSFTFAESWLCPDLISVSKTVVLQGISLMT